MLLDENIKAISHGVLKQMDLDLIQCEMFAEGGSELIKGLDVSFLFITCIQYVYGLFLRKSVAACCKALPLGPSYLFRMSIM